MTLPAGEAVMEWPAIENKRRRVASIPHVVRSPANGEHVIPFGKWRNMLVKNVPTEYLQALCLWDNYKKTQKTLLHSQWHQWLWTSHPETVEAARAHVKARNLCRECFRPLVPVGTARANGKAHADWTTRRYHKQCWRDLSDSDSD